MKKFITILVLVVAIVVGACLLPKKNTEYDYLRLHIRANSNLDIDQNVKYEVKDEVVKFLTPYFCDVKSKSEAIEKVNKLKDKIVEKCMAVLRSKGFSYSANVRVDNEYFPTRTYSNTTLESGYYDAVIVELGDGVGDNWWCVMYPPLCFVNKDNDNVQIKYKSKFKEWFDKIFG